ncbi:MAG TPA: plastocyanin/azurin family copper-binding protein [Solirubrobacteraceae bacterium]|nr:plastocyanin/azurin family copper-binding protein [Solirubrobacteraceae bacterium]
MKRLYSVAACLALGGALVAGCGSSSSSSSNSTSNSTPAAAPATSAPAAAPAAGGAVAVSMKNIQFAPKSVTAKVGQTVKWTNDDSVDHNVTATSGETFKSSTFGQGATYSHKLAKAGTIKYVCTIHPGMEGTIVVTK